MYPYSSSAAFYSASNTPPPPMFYPIPDPVHHYGYGMPMDHPPMHFHPIQPIQNPGMMDPQQYVKNEDFVAQPVEQFVGMPHGMIYGQPAMNFMVPYHQQPVMNHQDPIGNIENITPPPAAPEQKRRKRQEKKKVANGGKMHQNTECANCGCRETKMWRRNERGEPECNPCNLYERCNGSKRPARLWNKPTIRRRRHRAAVEAEQEAGPSTKMPRIKTEIDD